MNQAEVDYLKGGKKPLATASSLLVSSSKYLNHWRLREVFAHEGLRRNGRELALAYLVPDAIIAFEELKDQEAIRRMLAEEKAAKPEFAEWLDARFVSRIKAEDLAKCRSGTLGAKIHEFMTTSGLQLDFMSLQAPKDDYEYLQKRFAQSHDIEHMVTGLEPDPMGEHGLMACNMVSWFKYFSPDFAGELSHFNAYLTTTGMMRTALHYPKVLPTFLEAMRVGVEMGQALKKPLFLVRWEDYLDWTLPDIRKELNIVGAPESGAWAWTFEAWQEPA